MTQEIGAVLVLIIALAYIALRAGSVFKKKTGGCCGPGCGCSKKKLVS